MQHDIALLARMEKMKPDSIATHIQEARARYSDFYAIRAGIQAIPGIGGSLDTLLAGGASKIQMQRLESYIEILQARMSTIEGIAADLESEGFSDLVLSTIDQAIHTRSVEKRQRLAQVIGRQASLAFAWDEAENAARLLASLEDMHVAVLREAVNAPVASGPYEGYRVVTLEHSDSSNPSSHAVSLRESFTSHESYVLELICSELVSRGLLRDEGVGRLSTKSMTVFVATDLAIWLWRWISLPTEPQSKQAD